MKAKMLVLPVVLTAVITAAAFGQANQAPRRQKIALPGRYAISCCCCRM